MSQDKLIKKLTYAEIEYKFALAMSTTYQTKGIDLSYLDTFSYGKHVLKKEELSLSKSQEKFASILLAHTATYIMAVQLNEVMKKMWPNRLHHEDDRIRNASQIIRLIRNAFAHDPFDPTWEITPAWDNKIFEIENIIKLDTSELNGKKVERLDYGGPLSLLRLLHFVRNLLIENPSP